MEQEYDSQLVAKKANQFIVLSGCSGGGKSSLLAELKRRGFVTYAEPGRDVVREQLETGGNALPWGDVERFIELTIARSLSNLRDAARSDRIAFFDRGIIDQISAYPHRGLDIPQSLRGLAKQYRYRENVFMVPPWEEIFENDRERRHSFADAVAMYAANVSTYEEFDYRLVTVPKMSIAARAEFMIRMLRT